MADYERTTIKTTLERLPDATRAALSERIETALLSVPDGAPAFLTQSRRLPTRGTAVLSARLEDLEVGSLMPQLAGDGMDVTGFAVSGPDGGPRHLPHRPRPTRRRSRPQRARGRDQGGEGLSAFTRTRHPAARPAAP